MSNFVIGFLTGVIVSWLLRHCFEDKKTTIVLPPDPADYWKPKDWTPGDDNEK